MLNWVDKYVKNKYQKIKLKAVKYKNIQPGLPTLPTFVYCQLCVITEKLDFTWMSSNAALYPHIW